MQPEKCRLPSAALFTKILKILPAAFDLWAMASGTFLWRWLVEEHPFAGDLTEDLVTIITSNMLVRALQHKRGLRVVIEEWGRLPLCCVVAACAVRRRLVHDELATMDIIVTCGTFRGS